MASPRVTETAIQIAPNLLFRFAQTRNRLLLDEVDSCSVVALSVPLDDLADELLLKLPVLRVQTV